MYKKATLRRMQPITRRYARIINDLDGVARRLKNLTEVLGRLELDSTALHNRAKAERARQQDNDAHLTSCIENADPGSLDEFMAGQIKEYFDQPEDER